MDIFGLCCNKNYGEEKIKDGMMGCDERRKLECTMPVV